LGSVWLGTRRAVACALAVATVLVLIPAAAAHGRDKVPGIDVSKYQRKIDWRRVATTKIRFAILRASLGNSYVDTKYRRNVTGATRHGLVVGAYHYAKPNRGRLDARMEANHFLSVARNAPGDVIPVLDIEDSGGLGRRQLRRWALRWLRQVERELGVRPMIYSGNYFWSQYMGNTTAFARRGYDHWVAHWYVRRPDVPGRHWGGRGWTFWQYSARGRVPGIRGPVDLDWYDGPDLAHGTIASIEVQPPLAGAIEGPRIACGLGARGCARLADPGSEIVLRARPAPGAELVRWRGACANAGAAATCRIRAVGTTTVTAIFGRPTGTATVEPLQEAVASPPAKPAPTRPCRPADTGCAVTTVLSNAVASLRRVIPVLPAIGRRH
jgi:GH25 family lysozyme M1 (1,4-beta-N-acetylmuramidase)